MKVKRNSVLSSILLLLLPLLVYCPITFFETRSAEYRKMNLVLYSPWFFCTILSALVAGILIALTVKLFSKNNIKKLKLGICIFWLVFLLSLYLALFLNIPVPNFIFPIVGNLITSTYSIMHGILLGIYCFFLVSVCLEMKQKNSSPE